MSFGYHMAYAHVKSQLLWLPSRDLNMIMSGKCPRNLVFCGHTSTDAPFTANDCWRRVASLCIDGH